MVLWSANIYRKYKRTPCQLPSNYFLVTDKMINFGGNEWHTSEGMNEKLWREWRTILGGNERQTSEGMNDKIYSKWMTNSRKKNRFLSMRWDKITWGPSSAILAVIGEWGKKRPLSGMNACIDIHPFPPMLEGGREEVLASPTTKSQCACRGLNSQHTAHEVDRAVEYFRLIEMKTPRVRHQAHFPSRYPIVVMNTFLKTTLSWPELIRSPLTATLLHYFSLNKKEYNWSLKGHFSSPSLPAIICCTTI